MNEFIRPIGIVFALPIMGKYVIVIHKSGSRQRRIAPWPQLTRTDNFVKFERVVFTRATLAVVVSVRLSQVGVLLKRLTQDHANNATR